MNRRDFMKVAAGGAAALTLSRRAFAYAQSDPLRKFVQHLPGLTPLPGAPFTIPVATPKAVRVRPYAAGPEVTADYYRIVVGQYRAQLHPGLPKATTLWGYADMTNAAGPFAVINYKPLGGVIIAKRGRPVKVTFENRLPPTSIIPIDTTIPGADAGAMQNRHVTHLHGGLVPWTSDGGPFAWFAPNPLATNLGSATPTHGPDWQPGDYWYPNDQSARLVWYHDHAFGQTRTNAYANIASAFLLTDDVEAGLINGGVLPNPLGGLYTYGIPLVIQDKTFVPRNIASVDPSWRWGGAGDLWYPHVYEPADPVTGIGRWDWGPQVAPPTQNTLPLPAVSCVPEAFFDHMLVNGAVFPYLNVPAQRVRFRLLNACNARFLNLGLYHALSNNLADPQSGDIATLPQQNPNLTGPRPDVASAGPPILQIGTEGGFLPQAVEFNNPPVGFDAQFDGTGSYIPGTMQHDLLLAPAERADVVIDFTGLDGHVFILYSDTPAPFPGGDARNDYWTGDTDQTGIGGAPPTTAGFGPNCRTILQIRVGAGTPEPVSYGTWRDTVLRPALSLAYLQSHATTGDPPWIVAPGAAPGEVPAAAVVQGKTLNEDFDRYGRLVQRLGTTVQNGFNNQGLATYGRDFLEAYTESAAQGETQYWDVFNLTGDTHPIHFHLVNVQVLGRAPFDPATFALTGSWVAPDPNELGWKETVRMNPGEVTRVAMTVIAPAPPDWVRFKTSPRTGGYEYVWHCHILEHEEHDMMRNFVVTGV